MMGHFSRGLAAATAVTCLSLNAWAESDEPYMGADAAPADAAPADTAPADAAPADGKGAASDSAKASGEKSEGDGPRFRFGVAGGAGPLILSDSSASYTLIYSGLDLRFGAQINDLVGVYVQPQLGGYGGTVSGYIGTGGLVGFSGVVDFTLVDRFFVGAGAGFAVLNSPSGAEIHLRAGGYPVMGRPKAARRKGLMLGLDFRVHILDGVSGIAPTFNIGYEAF